MKTAIYQYVTAFNRLVRLQICYRIDVIFVDRARASGDAPRLAAGSVDAAPRC
jgi:hypothetical protein